jgi:putative oxidoreductase
MAAKPALIGRVLLLAARVALGGLFVYAGASKALDPAQFAEDIGHYRLLPHALALVLAVYLPWLEIICGGAVLARWRYRGALSLLAALCGIFALALGSAWWRGLDIECGCFGHALSSTLPFALARSIGLGAIALVLFAWDRAQEPKPSI